MIQFRLFGIPVTVMPWFWLTMAFISGGLQSLDSREGLFRLALFLLAGFLSILIHELGHALMVRFFRQPTQIVLEAFGGYATYPPHSLSRFKNFIVTAAGPIAQLALAAAVYTLSSRLGSIAPEGAYFLRVLWVISLYWALLNCLPIYPLDGGQMLNAILGPKGYRITMLIGIVIPIALIIWLYTSGGSSIFLMIFAAFFAYQNFQRLTAK